VIDDARRLDDGAVVGADLCIVGAGPAGLTIARELAGGPLRVCLLETGGPRGAGRAQRLLAGDSAGSPYPPLERTRAAGFGGTSSVWTGGCRALDAFDFEPRSWIPHSGWPFGRDELDRAYERAAALCGVDGAADDPRRAGPEAPVLTLPSDRLRTLLWRLSPPVRFGEAYRDEIAGADGVRVLLHAHALHLEAGADDRVTAILAGTLGGRRFRVEARAFVLAAGGIENPRLLLLSSAGRGGLGNAHDLVGRFFMEHPYVNAALFDLERHRSTFAFYERLANGGATGRGALGVLALGDALVRREELVRCGFVFLPGYKAHPAFASSAVESILELQRLARIRTLPESPGRHLRAVAAGVPSLAALVRAKRAERRRVRPRFVARAFLESVPDPENRVTLARRRDAFGRPCAFLRWRPGERERRTLARAVEVLGEELAAARMGRVAALPDDPATGWPASLGGGNHHIGTTRMHPDPARGVVDADGRVHGVVNLFVAGSSVFPTSGLANPTLTIVALALRLARHLERTLGAAPRRRP
jgi:choline dehydrogenase-like flavoprotein